MIEPLLERLPNDLRESIEQETEDHGELDNQELAEEALRRRLEDL